VLKYTVLGEIDQINCEFRHYLSSLFFLTLIHLHVQHDHSRSDVVYNVTEKVCFFVTILTLSGFWKRTDSFDQFW